MVDHSRPADNKLPTVGFWQPSLVAMIWTAVLLISVLQVPLYGQSGDRPIVAPAEAGWPHLRGPHYSGVSDERDLADAWPAQGPPVLWSRDLGQGYSSFSASGQRVFTQRQTLYGQYVICLNSETGETIWEHRYGWPYEGAGLYPGPRATPTLHGNHIYFSGTDGTIGCLNADAGNVIWTVNVNQRFQGRGTDFGYSCSPLVEDGKVILPVGGKEASIVALDVRDGSTVWTSGSEPASYCSAMPITLQGRRCVVSLLENALAVCDLKSGKMLWELVFSYGYNEHAASPIYDEPHLLIASPFRGGATLYRFRESQHAGAFPIDAPVVWQRAEFSNDVVSSVLVGGFVYGFDLRDAQSKLHRPSRGAFRCLDFKTGKVQWSTDAVGQAGIVVADGKLLLFNDRGEVILARASPHRYEELARTQVFRNEICWTAPALHQGKLYLRTQSKAVCLFVGKPDRLDHAQARTAQTTSDIAGSQGMDLTQLVGGEREHPFVRPDAPELRLWYTFSLVGVFGVAALFAGTYSLGGRLGRKYRPRRNASMASSSAGETPDSAACPATARVSGTVVAFWCAAFVASIVGMPLYNRFWHQYIFTWPATLFLAYQAALISIVWAEAHANRKRARWVSRGAVVFLLGVCLTYFHLCHRLSMGHEWVFLIGFAPAWPVAVWAARRLVKGPRPVLQFCWIAASFTVYFWSCGVYCLLQSAYGF